MCGRHYAFLFVCFGFGAASDLGTVGIGHVRVMSLARFVEQNGRISSYKYHCHLASGPFGWIAVGFLTFRDEALTLFLKM